KHGRTCSSRARMRAAHHPPKHPRQTKPRTSSCTRPFPPAQSPSREPQPSSRSGALPSAFRGSEASPRCRYSPPCTGPSGAVRDAEWSNVLLGLHGRHNRVGHLIGPRIGLTLVRLNTERFERDHKLPLRPLRSDARNGRPRERIPPLNRLARDRPAQTTGRHLIGRSDLDPRTQNNLQHIHGGVAVIRLRFRLQRRDRRPRIRHISERRNKIVVLIPRRPRTPVHHNRLTKRERHHAPPDGIVSISNAPFGPPERRCNAAISP